MIKAINKKIAVPAVLILVISLGTEVRLFFTARDGLQSILMAVLTGILMIAAISDLSAGLIPLRLVTSSLLLGLFIIIYDGSSNIMEHISGGVLSFFMLAILVVLTRGQIGGGDLLLFAVTGFFLGFSAVPGILFLSVTLTGIFSLFLVAFRKGALKTEIPFAPFLLVAMAVLNF